MCGDFTGSRLIGTGYSIKSRLTSDSASVFARDLASAGIPGGACVSIKSLKTELGNCHSPNDLPHCTAKGDSGAWPKPVFNAWVPTCTIRVPARPSLRASPDSQTIWRGTQVTTCCRNSRNANEPAKPTFRSLQHAVPPPRSFNWRRSHPIISTQVHGGSIRAEPPTPFTACAAMGRSPYCASR